MRTHLVLPLVGLLAQFACLEPLNTETYDQMDGMIVQIESTQSDIEHMQRSIELSILPPEDWQARLDPCPELVGLRVAVDGEFIETSFGGEEYMENTGLIFGQASGPFCPAPASSYQHYFDYAEEAPTETSLIEFSYQDQVARLAIAGLWSTPYWLVVNPHEELNDQIAVTPGDTVAFELNYANERIVATTVENKGVFTLDGEEPYDIASYALVSKTYDEASRRQLLTISPDAERDSIISVELSAKLEWDMQSCEGWLSCTGVPYRTSARYNLRVR